VRGLGACKDLPDEFAIHVVYGRRGEDAEDGGYGYGERCTNELVENWGTTGFGEPGPVRLSCSISIFV
jgi:hypothetical protein